MHLLLLSILCGFFSTAHLNAQIPSTSPTANLALTLDGDGDYVELPSHGFDDLKEATIEAWVKWDDFSYLGHWFYYGRSIGLSSRYNKPTPQFYHYDNRHGNALHLAFVESDLRVDQWYHFAATTGPQGMKLYINGSLVVENAFDGSFFNSAGPDFFFGYSRWHENGFFRGQIDEVRIWDIARSSEEIRRDMDQTLQQLPEHLVGYWNFDDGDARDRGGREQHGILHGDARSTPAERAQDTTVPTPYIISGQLVDERDQVIVNAQVEIWREGMRRQAFNVGGDGRFRLALFAGVNYELRIQAGELGRWLPVPSLSTGQNKHLYIKLPRANELSGTVRALDDQPLRNIAVDLLRIDAGGVPQREATLYSNAEGIYHFRNLRAGSYQIRCHGRGEFFYHGENALAMHSTSQLADIDCTLPPVDKGLWKSYNALDGFLAVTTKQILPRPDGNLFFLDLPNALWRFDGEHFEQQTPLAELVGRSIEQIFVDRDSTLWLATDQGVLHVDGKRTLPVDCSPLAEKGIVDIHRDHRGILWFASAEDGLWRYDNRCHGQISTENGLPDNRIRLLFEDRDGVLWIAHNKGISRMALTKGELAPRFLPFDNTELPYHLVFDIHQSRDGALWFGTIHGASRYDGQTHWRVPREYIERADMIYEDSRGHIWFGNNYNVVRYDGQRFFRITEADGQNLAQASDMVEDANGALWIAHDKGVSVYRSGELALFSSADGLTGNAIEALYAEDDLLWVGTDKGLERFGDERFLTIAHPTQRLAGATIRSILRANDHSLWIGSNNGVWQLTGDRIVKKPFDALSNDIKHIHRSGGDTLLLATRTDIVRFSGDHFKRIPISRTLTPSVLQSDPRGGAWVGQSGYGLYHLRGDHIQIIDGSESTRTLVSGHNGELWVGGSNSVLHIREVGSRPRADSGHPDSLQMTRYLPREGLIIDDVQDLAFRNGVLYVANAFGGVALFDGVAWSSLDTRDGLPNNRALELEFDRDGALWIGMQNYLVRYQPQNIAPQVQIASVQTDSLYSNPTSATIALGTRATVSYRAIDLRTIPAKRQYRHRIYAHAEEAHPDSFWSAATRTTRFEWTPQAEGSYVFEVQAIDRDLNYSSPAQLRFDAFLPWYRNISITVPGAAAISLLIFSLSLRTLRQRREANSLRERILEQERRARQRLEESNDQLQAARSEAERASEFKSTFLANMSHEIRTPLNAILGYAQILRGKASDSSEMRQGLDTIKNSGDHLLALIDEVLDLSKIEAGRQQLEEIEFNLVRLVEELGAMFELSAQRKGLSWQIEWSPHTPEQLGVRGDEGKLRQVLINLLSNAVKFTREGDVTLRIECTADQRVHFAVRDSGPGLSAEEQQAIFEPFKRTDEAQHVQGTGLGLSIARAHVEMMGGQLDVESAPNKGARFFFAIALPSADLSQTTQQRVQRLDANAQLKPGQQVSALVADDVEANRQVLSTLLAEMGVSATTANDGRQAVEHMQRQRFDIAFVDVRMPALDGFGVLKEVRSQLGKDAPRLVVVTASALAHERRQYFDAGFDAFVPKPVRREDLCQVLSDLLGVEFAAASDAPGEKDNASANRDLTIALPADLLANLRRATEAGRLTEINKTISEINDLGHAALAGHLQELARAIDLDAILKIAEQLHSTDETDHA